MGGKNFKIWEENKYQPRILYPEKNQTMKCKENSLYNGIKNVKYLGTNKEDVQDLSIKRKKKVLYN